MTNDIHQFFRERGISEVEAIIPDMAGHRARQDHASREVHGRRRHEAAREHLPADGDGGLSADPGETMSPAEIDIVLKPDAKTVREVPWGRRADGAGDP